MAETNVQRLKCPEGLAGYKVDEAIECLSYGDDRAAVERELMAACPDAYEAHPDDPDGEAGRHEWPEAGTHADRRVGRFWPKLSPAVQHAMVVAYRIEHGDGPVQRILLIAEIPADTRQEALDKLDDFREAVQPASNYGVTLYRPPAGGVLPKASAELAHQVLSPFKESSLYDDYQREDGWTDEGFGQLLRELQGIAAGDEDPADLGLSIDPAALAVPETAVPLPDRFEGLLDPADRPVGKSDGWLSQEGGSGE
jgi:hypothetical protein